VSLGLFAVIITCVVNTLLGFFVYLRNTRLRANLSFLFVSILITAWSTTDYLTNLHLALFLNNTFDRLTYVFAYGAVLAGWEFSCTFAKHMQKSQNRERRYLYAVSVVMVILSLTPYVSGRALYSQGHLIFTIGKLVILYSICLLVMLALIVRNLVSAIRHGDRRESQQANYVLFGSVATIVLALVSNVLIPSISSSWQSTEFGPILSLILVVSISYAIIRHRLFDARWVVIRSLGYGLSVLTLGLIFTIATFGLTNLLFSSVTANAFSVRVSYAVLAMVLAFTFAPLKKFFDKLTSQLFYRDAYDSQNFIEELNKVLVSTYKIGPLMEKSTGIIEHNLKPSFITFGIRETPTTPRHIHSTTKGLQLSEEELTYLRSETPKIGLKIIIVDELEDRFSKAKDILQEHNIAVLVRLSASMNTKVPGIGSLLLGPKKSGNIYDARDIKNIEIIANELVIAIQNAVHGEEIERFNTTLQDKVVEATRKIRRTNDKLRELDETKDDFISMASHQLRTPLTSVKGYISMVMEGDAGELTPMQHEMLGQAFFSSQRMVYLIADLLNVSRLKSGKFIIDPTKVNLAGMVQQELQQLEETAQAHSLTLNYDKPNVFPDLMLDETKIRQVIMNFIDNAIYYTPSGGHITVRLINLPTTVELRVEDDGMGVPKSEQPHLFTKFYRAGNARKARPDGTGLGLFMAKKVIIAQGGSIIFTSQQDKGSTFGFVFSKSKLAVPTNGAPETVSLSVSPSAS
jgi:signal transduction histidine kinase